MTSSQTGEEWLTLREAADLLGMHPATVRLWADRNELPSRRTNGGHRRFKRSDIEARLNQGQEARPELAAQLLMQSMLGRVRLLFTEGTLDRLPWYRHFNSAARDAYRSLGRRVLELLMRTLLEKTELDELQREALQLGSEYGAITGQSRVPVADAVRAFLYFHTLVDESVLQLAELGSQRDRQDLPWIATLYQIQVITSEILPALIEAALDGQNGQDTSPQS